MHQELDGRNIRFYDTRPKAFMLDEPAAAIFAQARAMGKWIFSNFAVVISIFSDRQDSVDWNYRNRFCPACGRRTVSVEAGHKRICPPQPGPPEEAVPCISAKGVHNFTYPRTGRPTWTFVLLSILRTWITTLCTRSRYYCLCYSSHRRQDIARKTDSMAKASVFVLGRYAQTIFKTCDIFQLHLSSLVCKEVWFTSDTIPLGFVEAGESVEEAVRREVREESGIIVSNVIFHSSQPWVSDDKIEICNSSGCPLLIGVMLSISYFAAVS